MKLRRKMVIIVGGCVLILAAILWALHEPYRPADVLRPIPADATFVSVHDDPAGRLDDLAASPVINMFISRYADDPDDVRSALDDPEFRKWFKRLAGKRVAVAYVPSLPSSGLESLVLVGWVGGGERQLRWLSTIDGIPGLTAAEDCGPRPVWTKALDGDPHGIRLSVSAGDGLIMACLSQDAEAVRDIVECFEKSGARSVLALDERQGIAKLISDESADKAWLRFSIASTTVVVNCSVSDHSGGNVSGVITSEIELPEVPAMDGQVDLDGLDRIVGDMPEAVCVVPSDYVLGAMKSGVFNGGEPTAWMEIVADALDQRQLEYGYPYMAACMLGGTNRGRIRSIVPAKYREKSLNIPVPTVIVAAEIGSGIRADELARDMIDGFNARYGAGVDYRSARVGGITVTTIAGTGGDEYSKLSTGEQVAWTTCGKWFMLCSNAEVLMDLAARYQTGQPGRREDPGRWLDDLRDRESYGYLWIDTARAGVTVADGIALWRLCVPEKPGTVALRLLLKNVEEHAMASRELGNLSAHLRKTGHSAEIQVDLR